jgi:uncharacterized protein (UPF0276 family)
MAADARYWAARAIPARAGVGFKVEHDHDVLMSEPDRRWFQLHPENGMGAGGAPHSDLENAREHYPLWPRGVGPSPVEA